MDETVSAAVPVTKTLAVKPRLKLTTLAGTGKGLWNKSSTKAIARLRDEWS